MDAIRGFEAGKTYEGERIGCRGVERDFKIVKKNEATRRITVVPINHRDGTEGKKIVKMYGVRTNRITGEQCECCRVPWGTGTY